MGYVFGPLSGRVTDAAIAVHRELGPSYWSRSIHRSWSSNESCWITNRPARTTRA